MAKGNYILLRITFLLQLFVKLQSINYYNNFDFNISVNLASRLENYIYYLEVRYTTIETKSARDKKKSELAY